jgi:hypothetical protein
MNIGQSLISELEESIRSGSKDQRIEALRVAINRAAQQTLIRRASRPRVKKSLPAIPCGVSTIGKLRVTGGSPISSKPAGRVLCDTANLHK